MEYVLAQALPSLEGSEDLASQAQVDKLVNRVEKLLEKFEPNEHQPMAKPRTESREISKWELFGNSLKSAWAVILIISGAVVAGWKLHSEFSSINAQIGSLRMAVKILADSQGGKTKELVDDALDLAKLDLDAGKSSQAQSALSIANAFIAEMKSSKIRVDPEFFAASVDEYRNIRNSPHATSTLADEAFKGTLELAEYRSTLIVYRMPKLLFTRADRGFVFTGGSAGSSIAGLYFDASLVTGDFISVTPPLTGTLADNISVKRSAIKGGFQTLDGIHWSEVTFIGTRIRYRGGELDLDHVTFIACTFEAPENDRGAKFAEYAALVLPTLQYHTTENR